MIVIPCDIDKAWGAGSGVEGAAPGSLYLNSLPCPPNQIKSLLKGEKADYELLKFGESANTETNGSEARKIGRGIGIEANRILFVDSSRGPM